MAGRFRPLRWPSRAKGKSSGSKGSDGPTASAAVAATEHTMYSLASISKPVTATGLMVLVERKQIDLDRPVNDYLGAARVRGRAGDAALATVRRVANHSSGLPLHYQFFYADEPFRPPSMDETIRRYGNLVTIPGERYEYSNLGYGILDYVISRVSGRPYAEFMREEVFGKLGLTHTSVHVDRAWRNLRRSVTATMAGRFRSTISITAGRRRFTPAHTTLCGSACFT